MSGAHVLVIEDDEWVARLLAVGLREAGHRVTLCTDGASGITTIHREVPDCVVCDVELPDIDGFAIGRSMRGAGGRVAATPLLFLCARDEEGETKLEALRSGGDAYLPKPFRIDEVAWTVTALIRLAERNRGIAPMMAPKQPPPVIVSLPPPSDAPDGVLEGDLAKVSIATILTVLEMEKHTGELEMTRGEHTARLHVETGNVDGGQLGELQTEPIAVLRTVLTWTKGRFRFAPSKKPARPMTGRATIGALLMEAARLEDEFKAGIVPRDKRISTLPPVSSRVNDLLGAAFPSSLPEPPSERDPLASPPAPPVAPSPAAPGPPTAGGGAPAPSQRSTTLQSITAVGKATGPAPNPTPRPFPAVPAPKPSPRPGLVPAPKPSPKPATPPRLPTPAATALPAGAPRFPVGPDAQTPIPTGATPFPPIAAAAPPGAVPPSADASPPSEQPISAAPISELGTSSLIDEEWDTSDEPMSLQPVELESARGGGPPPVPPKRPPTGPAPIITPPTDPQTDEKS